MNPLRTSSASCLVVSQNISVQSTIWPWLRLAIGGLAVATLLAITSAAWAQATSVGAPAEPGVGISGAGQVQAMKLLAPGVGWATIDHRLEWTYDDGATWKDVTPDPAFGRILSAYFLDETHGWAVLARNSASDAEESITIGSTATAGQSWAYSNLDANAFPRIGRVSGVASTYFEDKDHGWIVLRLRSSSNFSIGAVLHTVDGGSTWAELPSPPAAGEISFQTPQDGMIAGGPTASQLWLTRDGGQTWTEANIPIPEGCTDCRIIIGQPAFRAAQEVTMSVEIIDVNRTGVASLVSFDGGEKWNIARVEYSTGEPQESPVAAMVGAQSLLISASGTTVSIIREGSSVEGRLPEGLRQDGAISEADFASGSAGWLVYSAGWCGGFRTDCHQSSELIRTNDGGKTFRVITPPIRQDQLMVAPIETRPLPEQVADGGGVLALPDSPIRETAGTVLSQNTAGFDISCVPDEPTMKAWSKGASPYKVIGVYLGGCNVSCVPPAALGGQNKCDTGWYAGTKSVNTNLSSQWIADVVGYGWDLIPIWVGPQAPCISAKDWLIQASADGKSQADAAIAQAAKLSIANGIIYYDMEGYDEDGGNCSGAVKAFLSSWNAEMKANNFRTGIYGSLEDYVPGPKNSGADFLNVSPLSDAAWIASYSTPPNSTVLGLGALPDNDWSNNQRIHQWGQDQDKETWGGKSIPSGIDWDTVDAPVIGVSQIQPQAAMPTFSPTPGTYNATQSVTISDSTPSPTIYFTTNGSTPTTSSTKYTGPVTVSATETIEAIATASGYTTSAVSTAVYTISASKQAAMPTFSPAAGTYGSTQTVTISDSTPSPTIYYTTNGTTPTTSSTKYTGPITVNSSETIQAMAAATAYTNSAVAAAVYTITHTAQQPTVTTGSAGSITSSTAIIYGSVNPNGADTHIWFLIAANSSMSGAVQCPSYDAGAGTSVVQVQCSLSSMSAGATYYYQAVAQNSAGTVSGSVNNFTTTKPQQQQPTVTTGSAGSITSSTAIIYGSVNPNGADTHVWFLVANNSSMSGAVQCPSYDAGAGTGTVQVQCSLSGMSAGATYYYQAVAQNSAGTVNGSVNNFTTTKPQQQQPTVTTGSAGSITSSTAIIYGSVNPNGADTHVWFLVAGNNSMSGAVQCPSYDAGSGTNVVQVQCSLSSMSAGATYYYQAVAQNSAGTVNGSINNFTTTKPQQQQPTVTTGSAGSITSSTAIIYGSVNPNGADTHIWFLIAANSSMSGAVQCPPYDAGAGTSTVLVQCSLSGMSAGATYYYQAVAQNSAGTVNGNINNFTTSNQSALPAATSGAASGLRVGSTTFAGTSNLIPGDVRAIGIVESGISTSKVVRTGSQVPGSGPNADPNNVNAGVTVKVPGGASRKQEPLKK
jgi:hypothetical protein